MEYRQLGSSSLKVSPICFGCNVFGWTADEEMSFRLLDGWLDAGFNFYDTADVYSRWHDGNILGAEVTGRFGGQNNIFVVRQHNDLVGWYVLDRLENLFRAGIVGLPAVDDVGNP